VTPAQKERAIIIDDRHLYTIKTCSMKRGIPEWEVEEIALRLDLKMASKAKAKKEKSK
jgi:hypothetical protein